MKPIGICYSYGGNPRQAAEKTGKAVGADLEEIKTLKLYIGSYNEVVNQDDLDGHIRFMAVLAALLGCQGVDEFRHQMGAALNFGVTPTEIFGEQMQDFAQSGPEASRHINK